ncbi:MAG: DNA polymerase III subunit beta [Planctomycetota bacterium]|nr:DNA polymerase III subunit beta [Planctomycetota bacterium]MDA1177289.1 DNA polymerase III subunit beta [Planctomycetota bacterium]
MHILCERDRLWTAFQAAASVLPSRSPKPILQHIRFEATGPIGTMSATDLETGIIIDVDGLQCNVPGVVILPADRFGAILRETNEDSIELKSDGNNVELRAGKSRFQLPIHDPSEYPRLEGHDLDAGYFSLRGSVLRELVRKTLFATSQDSNRYDLGGVLLELGHEHINAVSTDGRRLAKLQCPCEVVGTPKVPHTMTIVPAKAMNLAQRIFGDAEDVHLVIRENEMILRGKGTIFFSRLLEGRFPKWEMVIPKGREGDFIDISVGTLLSSLRQASIVADQESRGIDFDFREGQVILSASTAERGNCRVPMPISYEGPAIDVRLDYRYLEEFLKALELDSIFHLSVKDQESAALCTTDTGYAYVLMPLSRASVAESVNTAAVDG